MADPDIVRKRQPFSRENEAFRILRLQRRFGLHARLRGDTTGCILKPGRKSFSPGIRLATWARKPSFPTEQNASSKSSIISQPPLGSTARIGRQESRRFGRVIAERAKSGAPELSSGVVSYMRLFSSDGILRAERLGGGASLC